MATIKDIAKALVERHKMKTGASEEFLQALVEVVNEGLIKDRIVKIKGFGTFKLQEVKERKSVNVNTGESVMIAAHDRITFTPDSVMRDLVNKPFAQFETVIVDNKEDKAPKATVAPLMEEAKAEEPKAEVPEVKEEPKTVIEEPTVKEEPETVIEEPAVKEEPKTVIEEPEVNEEPKAVVEVSEVNEEPKVDDDEDAPERTKLPIYIIIGIVAALLCFALGYLASHNDWFNKAETPAEPKQVEQVEKQTKDVDTVTVAPTTAPASPASSAAEDMEKYNSDARVKYGAYVIVGTETEVTVLKGQTLKGISKAYLGPDMECYVEAYNNVKEVKAGDKIRIPKLKVKKRNKKQ